MKQALIKPTTAWRRFQRAVDGNGFSGVNDDDTADKTSVSTFSLMCCCPSFYIQRRFISKHCEIGGVTERQKLKKHTFQRQKLKKHKKHKCQR